MSLISFTNIADGTGIDASDVNSPMNTIYNDYNGNIDSNNLADNAVTTAKITDGNVTGAKIATTAGNGALKTKIISISRDAGAASGDVAYTGVGFIPSSLIVMSNVDNTVYWSHGTSDINKYYGCIYQAAANTIYGSDLFLISYSNSTTWGQNAIVKSYDADGFTLTWTKTGTPTAGTMRITVLCYR